MPHRLWRGAAISRLSLGTAQLGLDYGVANRSGRPARGEAESIVREALRGGIVHFDTASAYGTSEEILGVALTDADVRVTTKLAASPAGLSAADLGEWTRRQVQASLARLCRDRVDFLLLHDARDLARAAGGLLAAVEVLKDEGRIGWFGASVYRPDEAERAIALDWVDVVQLPLNVLDGRWDAVLREGARRGVALFARSLFLQGFFWLSVDEVGARLPWAREVRRRLEALAEEIGCSPPELGMRFTLSHEEVLSGVVGCEWAWQVPDLVRLAGLPPFSGPQLETIRERMREVPERLLDPSRW